jgi:uncharacterized protein YjbI with pentapeptide repeats
MANQKHLEILKQGVEAWNEWRKEHRNIKPNFGHAKLSGAKLSGADLNGADLNGADLNGADLGHADLKKADLSGANLTDARLRGIDFYNTKLTRANLHRADLYGTELESANLSDINLSDANLNGAVLYYADLTGANLNGANLSDADLTGANLERANLGYVDLTGADLTGANLIEASLIRTNLTNADLTGCRIFGISAWKINLEGAIQKDLVITDDGEPEITVDNLEVAQFIYLLLHNQKIRDVINTITSKVVLILGRFTDERKLVLNALRNELRKHNYSPVVFDFEKPRNRNLTETVSTLAHLSRFIIADLTDAKSIPQELERIIPRLRVPIQSLLHVSEKDAYAMYRDFEDYHWVLPIHRYNDQSTLLRSLQTHIIDPAEQKAQELEKRK